MKMNQYLRLLAGFFVVLSTILAVTHSLNWLWFTGFIGVNLVQSAFTNWCPAMFILRQLGVQE